jgi:hypothetical protein
MRILESNVQAQRTCDQAREQTIERDAVLGSGLDRSDDHVMTMAEWGNHGIAGG